MGKYTIIADAGGRLVELLQREMVPSVIQNPNEIGLRSPEDHGDVTLGLFLYSIEESDEVRQAGSAILRNNTLSKVPVYLTLYYMITAYSSGDVKYRMTQEENILGKVIQVFHDHPIIPLEEVDPECMSGMDLRISMQRMTLDEKSKIWNFPNVGNRLSLFYKVTPVAIDSDITAKITRVTEFDINVEDASGRG